MDRGRDDRLLQPTLSGWQVADVPPSLLVLVVAAGLVCLGVAAALTRPWTGGRAGPGRRLVAARPGVGSPWAGPPSTSPRWAAATTGRSSRCSTASTRAGLGTLVVTLPLLALGWALYGGVESLGRGFFGALYTTAVVGIVPAAVALGLAVPLNPRIAPTR